MAKTKPTGWVGWIYFAGVFMLLAGILQTIAGLVALYRDTYYLVTSDKLIAFDFTIWGWIHLVLGVLVFAAGLAVLAGQSWGRMVGVALVLLSAIANLTFLAAYPIWSITAIVFDVLILYALTMHGEEEEVK